MAITKSQNIIITGGARGIGRNVARYLLSRPENHQVYLLDLNAEELEYAVTQHLSAYAPRVAYAVVNLGKLDEVRSAVNKAAEFFDGRIDVLVNNAGIARAFFTAGNGTMEDPATADQWQAYIDTHLNGPFWLSQAVIPYMKAQNPKFAGKGEKVQEGIDRTKDLKRHEEFKHLPNDLNGKDRLDKGGSIIHISSFRAHQSDPDCEGYGATKAGLIGLTQAMSVSCQRWGIRVNVISPGWISVPHECREGDEKVGAVQGAPHGEEAMDARAKLWAESVCERDHIQHTAGRVGIGEDVAEAVEYLMGAGFMNGHEMILDGGASKRKNPYV